MLRFTTAGESHGPALVSVLEGMPAGLPLLAADVDAELHRRQPLTGAPRGTKAREPGPPAGLALFSPTSCFASPPPESRTDPRS